MTDPNARKSALLLQIFASPRHDHKLTMIQQQNLFDLLGRGTPEALMRGAEAVPRVDVNDTGAALEVTAELPGLSPADIDVAGIAATFETGVPRIRLPRLPEKPGAARSIPVLPN
jgi:HSP20 family molecular chaperone IbpA